MMEYGTIMFLQRNQNGFPTETTQSLILQVR
ncbi:hypothetical protein NC653_027162 [Populus alba x Populus x berolinensis]|uniref:Uncharacterized protein n=1 Tax=Populus alba x Populus x berolinensis TaxID=444605 RepID=A0AAD6M4K2_9ROSI|nr:hypothetical protein NC653_027162 [Populus alba x Populus x berolinensis]